jgi:hypothetical protein
MEFRRSLHFLLVLCKSGTSAYMLKSKTRSKTYCYILYSFKSRLPAREGSGVVTCPTAPDLASLLWRALALSCALPLQILPLCLGGLRRCHVSCGMGPHLSAREGFDVVMCVEALDPASLLKRALVLLCVSWLWTLPPYLRGLHRCHMSPWLQNLPPCSGGFRYSHVPHGSQ